MVFNSDIFLFAFLPIVFVLFQLFPSRQPRYVLLTVSSFIFYGYWNWRFCFLLLFSSLVSFFAAQMIERATDETIRRRWMIGTVVVDLCVLGFFKYFNFFIESFTSLLPHHAAQSGFTALQIVLPVGISFYTFHTISYVVDVASKRVRATHNIFEYLTYVSLFSQLVAGPIVRFRQIEKDLAHIDAPLVGAKREEFMAKAVGFFVVGMVKKVIIADNIAVLIDPLLASSTPLPTSAIWIGLLGYAYQLYYDFSGYSDMAIGLGYLFGIHIPQNFNSPYKSLGVDDFWRRWHISLSKWLRDYVFIPTSKLVLRGKKERSISHVNMVMLFTMTLCGLWHGANWTFVMWGAYNGVLLMIDKALKPWLVRLPKLIYRWGTFWMCLIGMAFFRAPNLTTSVSWLKSMFGFQNAAVAPIEVPERLVWWVVFGFLATNILPETWDFKFSTRRRWAIVYAVALFICYLAMNNRKSVFLYYQF